MKVISLFILLSACASHEPDQFKRLNMDLEKLAPKIRNCANDNNIQTDFIVKLQFTLNPQGQAINSQIAHSTLKDEKTKTCILDKLSKQKFHPPKNGGTIDVVQPFNVKRKVP